jgi:ABC-type Fe3+ transport system substrate-binding protein
MAMTAWWRMLAALPPLLLLAAPLALRERAPPSSAAAASLVIIGPNNETIRSEFGRAFALYARRELGLEVAIDWRTPGGTSEIITLVDEQFKAAFQATHPGLSAAGLKAFNDAALDKPGAGSPELRQLRQEFLASDLGIGLDLMMGGGEFDHRVSLAERGYVIESGLVAAMPEVFREEVIPARIGNETIYDPRGRYLGIVLASFGICSSPDRLALIPGMPPLRAWSDLGDPRLFAAVAMADPSRSGSIATCYVMMIQEAIARRVAASGSAAGVAGSAAGAVGSEVLDAGWGDGFALIKRIAGNARYVTDSATRVPYDVARGDAAAGMCIDFYGRAEAEWTRQESGRERVRFITPVGGSSFSADPVSCFRGAPHRDLALAFMRFLLQREAQQLWDYRVGEAGGPRTYALRRLPVRRDLYSAEDRRHMSDPDEDPFARAGAFHAEPGWTGAYFDLIRATIKAVVIDPRPELVAAWGAILRGGGPQALPQAMAEFCWLPYARSGADAAKQELGRERAATMRGWCVAAQEHYRAARLLAEAGR